MSKAMMYLILLLILQLQSKHWVMVASSYSQEVSSIALLDCDDHCGNVKIPYPFGIEPKCSHDPSYQIICNTSFNPPKPFLQKYMVEVVDINWPGRYSKRDPRSQRENSDDQKLTIRTSAMNMCSSDDKNDDDDAVKANTSGLGRKVDFEGSPYRLSRWYNVLMVENCGGGVVLKNRSGQVLSGCASYCSDPKANSTNCYGIGCCQASLLPSPTRDYLYRMEGLDYYDIALDHSVATSPNTCTLAAGFVESGSVKTMAGSLSRLSSFPTVLEWNVADSVTVDYDNVSCFFRYPFVLKPLIQCQCNEPYDGNPYLPNGCQVVRECQKCRRHCAFNDTGSYYYCEKNQTLRRASILGFSIGMGLVLLVLGCYWLYRLIKWRMKKKRKAKYFKKNGGLLLQQEISSNEGVVEKAKIFSITELENATENFSESRILGQGGQGTVYKGMLMDGRIVAIKKSKKIDESQLEQFINEVVILSQINHRNVVKLLGCCLETEVPLLVYEFIPNGTLYQLLHVPSQDFHVTWKMRLQIAAESASAVAYLHSSSSAPIYHRDIKSSNILLDDKYRAKVSDFGTSKAITIEQTHITTFVRGTCGYLDPEYFQSNQFTEKSDVYSFGVVLLELITGKKPVGTTQSGDWISLVTEFLSKMEFSARLDIVDDRIFEEGKEEEFVAVANLAKQCLNMNGKRRPTMKEIAKLLDEIRSPYVPNLEKPSSAKNRLEITKISDMQSGPFSTSTFIDV